MATEDPDWPAERILEEIMGPQPTFGTHGTIPSVSSSRVGYECGEDCGQPQHEHEGEELDGVMGWGAEDE